MNVKKDKKKIMAIASGGGHFIQLLRLQPAFEGCRKVFVTTEKSYKKNVGNSNFYVVTDANRNEIFKLLLMVIKLFFIILKERPDFIISTGAAPGAFAILFGKILGAKTIWIDSIANVDIISMSGQKVKRYADLYLTQWPHLETPDGPFFKGAVI